MRRLTRLCTYENVINVECYATFSKLGDKGDYNKPIAWWRIESYFVPPRRAPVNSSSHSSNLHYGPHRAAQSLVNGELEGQIISERILS